MPDDGAQAILIIEDNDDDYEATVRALKHRGNLANPIRRCHDGQEAWDYLCGAGRFAPPNRPPRPVLALLDLNMPGLDGRRLLMRIKNDVSLRMIPVVVMTTSSEPSDVAMCYDAGANTYVRKPVSFGEFVEAMGRLQDYWFQIALLPGGVRSDVDA